MMVIVFSLAMLTRLTFDGLEGVLVELEIFEGQELCALLFEFFLDFDVDLHLHQLLFLRLLGVSLQLFLQRNIVQLIEGLLH